MSASTSLLFQDLVGDFYSRRLLLLSPSLHQSSSSSASAPPPTISHGSSSSSDAYGPADNSFDSNVVMVLSVLLCALICSLGLNSIIRCALRCSSFVGSDSSGSGTSTRLANTGVKKKALKTFPVVSYSSELKLPGLDTECVICLSEFVPGERVRLLPKCHHGFHVRCIDKWLSAHSSCPTCRHCLIETCQKIVGCSGTGQASSSSELTTQLAQPIQITIAPLEPEGPVRNYRGTTS
ncbi:hypothetical protein CDL15_Pgr028258 [Punica granatum]|uniref:RING-type E3 ubiquitin transferase n=1 Tax=Punica granatum TaxID=22663 RepID=A0A218WV60_PUNGR|nr:hypothetical protein CDL15_Pgr028258 [Punica granatum]PKI58617.1 hypothetical protein CRG98_021006 [Punica granatum]